MNQSSIIALGFFDGVHIGHGALLARTRALADQYGLRALAITFDRHPSTLLGPEPLPLLSRAEDRMQLMQRLYGIDEVKVLPFDRKTMARPWLEFVQTTLMGEFGAKGLVCGEDYRCGARGEGSARKLEDFCLAQGLHFACIEKVCLEGQAVSSTRIRRALQEGRFAEAVHCLGHGHLISGKVVSGRRLGRTLGIPTANVRLAQGLLCPRHGVYAAWVRFDGQVRQAVVNIGNRPTVGGHHVTVEPWILDFDGDLYDHDLQIELMHFLRPETAFPSLEELRAQIHRDAEQTSQILSEND